METAIYTDKITRKEFMQTLEELCKPTKKEKVIYTNSKGEITGIETI